MHGCYVLKTVDLLEKKDILQYVNITELAMPHTDPFRAIADPNRRRILDLLHDSPLSVNELVRRVHLSQPATSQILNVLKSAGLVDHRREGRRVIYSINNTDLKKVLNWVSKYSSADTNVEQVPNNKTHESPSGQISH